MALTLALPVTVANLGAAPPKVVVVSNGRDFGPGSFREAINRANLSPSITLIQFVGRASIITLHQTVWFTGSQDLTIVGNGSTLDGANADGPAFRATGGGNLFVSSLVVRNAPAEGIAVEVPQFATGTVRVTLLNVGILDNAGHGVLVNDQDDPVTPTAEHDSAASVEVTAVSSRFIRNGYSVSDRDGLRVNEGGEGHLTITLLSTSATDNGADGVEVDERGAGDVRVYMFASHVNGNGPFDPADLDDGFDIDENDDGSIVGFVAFSTANDNFEEGLDFNENHAGDLRVDLLQVEANRNREEGIDYEEDDDFVGGGDLVAQMLGVTANGNGVSGGDAGLKIREKGDGNLDATLNRIEASNNLVGGISVREDAIGNLTSSIERASTLLNAGHGIDFDENRATAADSGDLTAKVSTSNSSGNTGAGVRADQQLPGLGTLLLSGVTLDSNAGGATTGSNVTVTVAP
jgi:hypothetical protein